MYGAIVARVCALATGCCLIAANGAAGDSFAEQHAEGPADTMRCSAVFLEHADCDAAAKQVGALFSDEPRRAVGFAPAQAVLLRGSPREVEQMKHLLTQIDIPSAGERPTPPSQRKLHVIRVSYAKAADLAQLLGLVIRDKPSTGSRRKSTNRPIRLVVDERTNVIVILADEEQAAQALELVGVLDVPVDRAEWTGSAAEGSP